LPERVIEALTVGKISVNIINSVGDFCAD